MLVAKVKSAGLIEAVDLVLETPFLAVFYVMTNDESCRVEQMECGVEVANPWVQLTFVGGASVRVSGLRFLTYTWGVDDRGTEIFVTLLSMQSLERPRTLWQPEPTAAPAP